MDELKVKKDFTDIYTQDSPYEYLKEMDRLEYSIPDYKTIVQLHHRAGCIGYIGYKAFSNLLKVIKNRQSNSIESETQYIAPIFAFSVLRIFDMEDIEEVFKIYDYTIVKSDIKPIRQRNFSNPKEKSQTISLLHDMEINTKRYEDDGNFYADFYIAKSKS